VVEKKAKRLVKVQKKKEKKKKENGRGSPSMDDFQRVGEGTRVQGRVGRRRAGRSLVLMNL
jgi:hypothetical protein